MIQLDYRRIATYYGEGTTYDAIEGQFRKIRAEAAKMKSEVESGVAPQAPPRGNSGVKSECSTPRKSRKPRTSPKKVSGVISGRVTKSLTPTKKRAVDTNAVIGIKQEMVSSESSVIDGTDEADGMFEAGLMKDLSWDGGWQDYGQEV